MISNFCIDLRYFFKNTTVSNEEESLTDGGASSSSSLLILPHPRFRCRGRFPWSHLGREDAIFEGMKVRDRDIEGAHWPFGGIFQKPANCNLALHEPRVSWQREIPPKRFTRTGKSERVAHFDKETSRGKMRQLKVTDLVVRSNFAKL